MWDAQRQLVGGTSKCMMQVHLHNDVAYALADDIDA
jgi:hypothetical protein